MMARPRMSQHCFIVCLEQYWYMIKTCDTSNITNLYNNDQGGKFYWIFKWGILLVLFV